MGASMKGLELGQAIRDAVMVFGPGTMDDFRDVTDHMRHHMGLNYAEMVARILAEAPPEARLDAAGVEAMLYEVDGEGVGDPPRV